MKKIESLTPDQEKLVNVHYRKWLDNGRSTDPLNMERAVASIKTIYKCAGFKEPAEFIFLDSPFACQLEVNLRLNTPKVYNNMHCGNLDWSVCWAGFYDYVLNVLFPDQKDNFKEFLSLVDALQNVHTFIPFEKTVYLSNRPEECSTNAQNKLHADLKPALKYRDGYSLYILNGIEMPKWIVETPGLELDTLKVLAEKNVDIRREGLRKIPIDKIVKDTKAVVLDSWREYILYNMDFNDGKIRRVLSMKNPSIDAMHYERVEDDINTCQEALAWRNGLKLYTNPEVLT